VLNIQDIAAHPDYLTNKDRVRNRDTLAALIAGLTGRRTRADLLASLEKVGVPAGPINSVADALHDPQATHRGMIVDLPHPGVKGGSIPSVRTPILIDGEPMVARTASPDLPKE